VTRLTRRGLERALRFPAPAPHADLGQRLKDQIPEDAFAASAQAGSRVDDTGPRPIERATRRKALARPGAWALAASVLAAIGAGWLAVRTLDTPDPLEPTAIEFASRQEPAAPPEAEAEQARTTPAAPGAARKVDELAKLEPADSDRSAQASSPPPAPERRGALRRQPEESPLRDAAAQAADAVVPRAAAEPREVVGGSEAPPSAMVETESETGVDPALASRSAGREDREVARETQSLRDARVAAKRPIDVADVITDRTWRLVEASLRPRGAGDTPPPLDAITIKVSKSHLPGRAVLWMSAWVPRGEAGNRDRAADALEVELDPALVTSHRLLASRASTFPPRTPPPNAAEGSPTAVLEQVTALYELEVGGVLELERRGVLDPDAVLGTVRVRDGRSARKKAESPARDIVAAGVFRDWRINAHADQLAVLGAEIASSPAGVSPEVLASLRAELERLLAEAGELDAARARALLDVLPR
jgi:hypothetical protein